MIIDKVVLIKGNSKNLKYYRSLGYIIEVGDTIYINVEHLSKGSTFKVNCTCDKCGVLKQIAWGTLYKYINGNINNNYFCSSCNSDKRIKTNNIKYGGNSPTCHPSVISKIKKTNLDRWGNECTLQSDILKPIVRDIFVEKYGVDNPLKSIKIQNKCKSTLIERYEVTSPLKSKQVYENLKKTNLGKYGVENVFSNDDIKKKIIKDQFNKFGMFYTQTEEMKLKSVITSNKNWGSNNYSNSIGYIKTILSKQKIKYSHINFLSYKSDIKEYEINCDKCNNNYCVNNQLIYSRLKYNIELCTICNTIGTSYISSGENNIYEFLTEYEISTKKQNRNIIAPYHIDLIVEDKKIAIEYNGIWWHNDLHKEKSYHKMKYDKCNEVGFQLIQIWEDDWKYKSDIVKSILLNKLGKSYINIFARKCHIKIVNNKDKDLFLEENHLQGKCSSSINIGLFNENSLVSLMTFGKRNTNGSSEFELIRFSNKINHSIVGGASKLFNYFLKTYNFTNIISYSDNSISNGNLYKKLGFEYISTSINYYWCDGDIKYHRFNFNKKKLVKQGFDSNKTEIDIMRENGFNRIWGAGNKKWIFRNKN